MDVGKLIRWINSVWRFYTMHQQAVGFMRGIGAGILVGVTVAAVGGKMMQNNSLGFRRRAGRTLRSLGDLLDGIQGAFR